MAYYVTKTGNDANDGSAADDDHAWLTLVKAFGAAGIPLAGGDTLYVGAGTYAEDSGSGYLQIIRQYTSPVVARPLNGVNRSVIVTGTSYGISLYYVANLTLHGFVITGTTGYATGMRISGRGENLEFYDCTLNGAGSADGMEFAKRDELGMGGIILRRCIVNGSGKGFQALGLAGQQIAGIEIDDCDIVSPIRTAVQISYADSVHIHNSRITTNAAIGYIGLGLGADGSADFEMTNVVVEDNVITADTSHALLVGGGCVSPVIRRNRCVSANNYPIVIKGATCTDAIVTNNLFIGETVQSVLVKGSVRPQIVNNTLICTTSGQCFATVDNSGVESTGVVVKNNVMIAGGAATCWAININSDDDTLVADHNVYDGTMGALIPALGVGSHSISAPAYLDSEYIPMFNSPCNPGNGDNTLRSLGELDFLRRPKLRMDAGCIGAVTPQRKDNRNVLLPLVQHASEI